MPTKNGFVFLDPSKFAADFGADLPTATAEFMARSQMPVSGAAFGTKLTAAAWHDKASHAVHVSHPRAVAQVIETAARLVKQAPRLP